MDGSGEGGGGDVDCGGWEFFLWFRFDFVCFLIEKIKENEF